ncbi:hypothetical protein JTE90_001852 [Oedothorax gibbosus]|uniref:Uncharacterized protein n=1 Tax=Oedothorax gibbosus TaxID=931172 RepID=A0AAV6VMH0_9ARAC|nr:hypothetical protein JTE90_001852 [Oedothorax gibbosus]
MSDSKKEEDECQNWKDSRGFYIESVNGSEISWKFNKRGHFVRQDVENQFSNINLSQYKPNTLNIKGEKETLDNSHESDSRTNAHKCAFTLQEYFDYKLNNNNKVKVKNRRKIPQPKMKPPKEYLLDESDMVEFSNITETETSDDSSESDCTETEENLTDSRKVGIPEHETDTNQEYLLDESGLLKIPNITESGTLGNLQESDSTETEENLTDSREGLRIPEHETDTNPENLLEVESDLAKLPNITQRNTLDNSHESYCISGKIFSQRDESNQISKEEFLNNLVREDEGICQVEGYNVETNEAIQGILQSSKENYQYKKNEKEIYTKGCVEDTEDVSNVGKEEQDLYLITEGKETGEKPAEETDKMEIDEKHVKENYLQENLPVVIEVVEGKQKIYSILYKSPWEIAYLHDQEINISKIKRLPSIKEQLGIGNLVDYFIEEQISKLCSDSHRAGKFEYIYKQEYKPGDEDEMISMKNPKAKKNIVCVWHVIKGKKKCDFLLEPNSTYMKHFVRGTGSLTRQCNVSNPQKELVLPERDKVGPLKKPKKLSVLEQVLKGKLNILL